MTLSVRARLTLSHGAILAAVLVTLAMASYSLLERAMLEQVDQALYPQLRSALLMVAAEAVSPATDSTLLPTVARSLRQRGLETAYDETARVLATRAVRTERGEAELRDMRADNLITGPVLPAALLKSILQAAARAPRRSAAFTVSGPTGGVRVLMDVSRHDGRPLTVAATESLDEVDELLSAVRGGLLITLPLVVAIALGVGYVLARQALAPVAAMTAQARHIGARTLHERLHVANPNDEMGQLAATFNAVLDRVDRAMAQQQHFTADASHELRTPVAIIRSEADVALGNGTRTPEEYREALTVIREGSEQLSHIVNDMFLLARADAGQGAATLALMYLDELVTDTVRSLRSLAALRHVEIAFADSDEAPTLGDEGLLRRALVNLLDNALKYAPPGSRIDVTLNTTASRHQLRVRDRGRGVPTDARALVFDRFYRADAARSTDASKFGSGAGLGLSIAREIAEWHGGELTLLDLTGDAEGGAAFELSLPIDASGESLSPH
jgi:two-component system OmpR family sensor kinase